MRLTLNSMVGGKHAGFLYARQLGYYAAEGFDVTIDERRGSAEAASRVVSGGSDFAVIDALAAMQVRSQGGRLRIVSTIEQSVGLAILSLHSPDKPGVQQPSDLAGRSIGAVANSTGRVLLNALLAVNQVDPNAARIVDLPQAGLVDALLLGQVDAIVGTSDVEALQLGVRQEPATILLFGDAGIDIPGLSLVATDDLIERQPDLVNRFVHASLRGWDAARAHPAAAARSVVEQFLAGYENEVRDQLLADLPLLCRHGNATFGGLPDSAWSTSFGVLTTYDLLPRDRPISDYFLRVPDIGADAPRC